MSNQILENLKTLLQVPDLASKRWIYEQYDSQVMNDTIQTGGDAAIVRVHGTNKALAMTCDCTPRYVAADAFEGAKQAVAETYRNISAVGARPLAITNCLNFGNPKKPEIMGQIVRSIKGITEACKALDYPVVSGNVSLYNETDGSAIKPTPAIGGVGLFTDLSKRCSHKFKSTNDDILLVGKSIGHLNCSLFEREILKISDQKNPPIVDLSEEKKNSEFIRELIAKNLINACHDISDGGLLVTIFEMCNEDLGCKIDVRKNSIEKSAFFFGEEQSRYLIATNPSLTREIEKIANSIDITISKVGIVVPEKISIESDEVNVSDLIELNNGVLPKKFS